MPVDTVSTAYAAMADRWRTARDCVIGGNAVKAGGTRYLPPLAGHNPNSPTDDYRAYLQRALFFNACARTIEALAGMIFRAEPVIECPEVAAPLIDDVDLAGHSLQEFAKAIVREVLTVGRVGVLVDHTSAPAELRPFMSLYAAETILDVVEEPIGGAPTIIQVRLRENYLAPDPDDEFATVDVNQIRVLDLPDGNYRQRIFRSVGGSSWEVVEEVVPTIDGAPLDRIPFWIITAEQTADACDIEPPLLMDLIETNLVHYRTDADYRNAIHVAGVPTLFISGMAASNEPLRVGTFEAQYLEHADAKAYYVSYGADGATAIRQSMLDLLDLMAFLGARLLTPEKRAAETAETARIHRMGEISVLANVSSSCSAGLTAALRQLLDWALLGGSEDAAIILNTRFLPAETTPQMIQAMLQSLLAGKIPGEEWWAFLKQNEVITTDKDWPDAQAEIEDEQELLPAPSPEPVVPGQDQEDEEPAQAA